MNSAKRVLFKQRAEAEHPVKADTSFGSDIDILSGVHTVHKPFLIEMRKTDCFGETKLAPHVPSSS